MKKTQKTNDISVLKWIYKSCGKRRRETAVLVILNAWSALCVTLFAMLSKTVMDNAESHNREALIKNVIILFLLIASQIISRIISSYIQAVGQGKAEIALKTRIFSSIIYGSYTDSAERHSGDLMTRLTGDVLTVSDTYVVFLPALTGYAVRVFTGAAALFMLDRRFAFIFVICGILVIITAALFRKILKNLHQKVQERDSRVRSFMQEMLENLFAIKVFGIEDKVINRSIRQQKKFYREKVRKTSFSILASIGFSIAFAAGFLGAMAYGAYGVLGGTMTFGTVVAIIQLVNQLQSPVIGITSILPAFFAMTASAQRLIEISSGERELKKDADTIDYDSFERIKASHVSFGYGEESVFSDSSFVIEKGDFVGIKGPSGAGKSTIFKLITGLYTADDGEIHIETTYGNLPCKEARSLYSVVPQGNMLFSGTVRENITMLRPDATEEEIEKAISDSCAEFAYDLENGLDFVLGEDGAGISEGQAQRLAIARALLGKGKILLMDEATSALDVISEDSVLQKLAARDDLTVLFITHRESVLEKCKRIITVSNGKIAEN